ncbi:polysaccharide deacetylase family protein [Haliscomenobacter sp.]|uniref:polysaccharide deacetylase family protein n=1 Tax=Haliscomenobacter sp. TaxID=2717303 RepID=UPI003364F664
MYLIKTPQFIQNMFPHFTWRIPTSEKQIFLTFDDGPIPEVTPWVLDQLEKYQAKASFFCVGDNIRKYPEIFQQVRDAGHTIGNHTMNHLNGWVTENLTYFHNIRQGASQANTSLFRPPYGRVTPKQTQFLLRHYRIVMWDVLSGDFDTNISPDQVLKNVVQNVAPGSIVVFHDSVKSQERLEYALPKVLEHFTALGYTFDALNTHEMVESELICKRA